MILNLPSWVFLWIPAQAGIHRRAGNAARPVIADLIRNPEGQGHATLSNYWLRPWRKLVLASRQHPQGRAMVNKPAPPYSPSPLMGEESKVRVSQRLTGARVKAMGHAKTALQETR